MCKQNSRGFTLLALLTVLGTLSGTENENIVFGPQKGAWHHSGTVVPAGENGAGDLVWSGKRLQFVPADGACGLKNTEFFSFMLRVPETMREQNFQLTFVYRDGSRKRVKNTTPRHIGWQRYIFSPYPVGKDRTPVRKDAVREVVFTADKADFQAFLRDVRMVSGVIDHRFPEDRVQPVTKGCFFPENTLDATKAEVLADPEFAAKMREIERLRRSKLKLKLDKVKEDPAQLTGIPMFDRIRPDGSFEGLSYEDVVKKHQETKLQMSTNQNYIYEHTSATKAG